MEAPGLDGQPLTEVHFDLRRGEVRLQVGRLRVVFEGVRATTLLAPWDGTAGVVEALRLVHAEDGERCYELRVQFPEVPRVYRIVCAGLRTEE